MDNETEIIPEPLIDSEEEVVVPTSIPVSRDQQLRHLFHNLSITPPPISPEFRESLLELTESEAAPHQSNIPLATSAPTQLAANSVDRSDQIIAFLNALDVHHITTLYVDVRYQPPRVARTPWLKKINHAAVDVYGLWLDVPNFVSWFEVFLARVNEFLLRPHDYVGPELNGYWKWSISEDTFSQEAQRPTHLQLPLETAAVNLRRTQIFVENTIISDFVFGYFTRVASENPTLLASVSRNTTDIFILHGQNVDIRTMVIQLIEIGDSGGAASIPGWSRFKSHWTTREHEIQRMLLLQSLEPSRT